MGQHHAGECVGVALVNTGLLTIAGASARVASPPKAMPEAIPGGILGDAGATGTAAGAPAGHACSPKTISFAAVLGVEGAAPDPGAPAVPAPDAAAAGHPAEAALPLPAATLAPPIAQGGAAGAVAAYATEAAW